MHWNRYVPERIVPQQNRIHQCVRETNSGGPIEGISQQVIGSRATGRLLGSRGGPDQNLSLVIFITLVGLDQAC